MDLGQNWGSLNRILYPRKKGRGGSTSDWVFVAHGSGRALRIIGDQDALLFSTGAPLTEALNAVGSQRKTASVDTETLDRALAACLKSKGAIYQQIQDLRTTLVSEYPAYPAPKEHFLLSAVRSGWGRFFPSSFGIYLHLEGVERAPTRTLMLIFRKGRLTEFDEPDVSSISRERRQDLGEVVKVLRERYRVPVQGFAMNQADFEQWSEAGGPAATWRKISKALRQDRLQLVPFRFRLAAMLGAKGIFGF